MWTSPFSLSVQPSGFFPSLFLSPLGSSPFVFCADSSLLPNCPRFHHVTLPLPPLPSLSLLQPSPPLSLWVLLPG